MPSSPTCSRSSESVRSPSRSAASDAATTDSPNSNPDENMSGDDDEFEDLDVEEDKCDDVMDEEDVEGKQELGLEKEDEIHDDGEEDSEVEDEFVEDEAVAVEVGADDSAQNTDQGNIEKEFGSDLPESSSPAICDEYSGEDKKNKIVDEDAIVSKEKSNLNNEGPKSLEFGHLSTLNENEHASSTFGSERLEMAEHETAEDPENVSFKIDTSIPDSVAGRAPQTEHSSYMSDKEYSKEIFGGVRDVEKVHSDTMNSENANYSSFFDIKNTPRSVGQRDIMGDDHVLPKDINPIKADVLKHISSSLSVPHTSTRSNFLGKKTSDVICDFFAKGWCIKGSSCKFVHVKSNASTTSRPVEGFTEEEERPDAFRSTFQSDYLSKMKSALPSDFVSDKIHIGEHGRKRNWSQFCDNGSNNHDAYFSRSTSPFKGAGSLNSGFSAFMPSSSIKSASHNILSSQSSFDASACLQASKSPSSLQFIRNSSPFSGYDTGNVRLTDSTKVPKFSYGFKSEISSYDWAPSVPFRPSVFITPSKVLSPGSQYDPLRDSIESSAGHNDKYPGVLPYIRGASGGLLSDEHANGKCLPGNFDADFVGDKYSVFGSNNHNAEANVPTGMSEPVGNSVSISVNRGINFNENTLPIISSLNEVEKSDKFNRHSEQKHRKNVDKEFKPHKDGLKNDANGDVYKETKIQRHFRTVLVDFVKDLVKPSWRVGLVSKDSHNLIVKKAVDKVLGTLHPHQMPGSFDAIKHYILAAEPKITKLVEGYIEKYGKS